MINPECSECGITLNDLPWEELTGYLHSMGGELSQEEIADLLFSDGKCANCSLSRNNDRT